MTPQSHTIDGHHFVIWGDKVLLRDVLAYAGYAPVTLGYRALTRWNYTEAYPPGTDDAYRVRHTSGGRPLAKCYWVTPDAIIDHAYRMTGGERLPIDKANRLIDIASRLAPILTGKPVEQVTATPTPAPLPRVQAPPADEEAVTIPTPAEIVNGRYSKALTSYLGRCASTLTASADTLWLSGSVSVPVPTSVPAHVRAGLAEDAAKALESKGWSVDVHKATADGGQSIALDIAIDTVST